MRKILPYFVFYLISQGVFAQIDLKDNDIFCDQYSKIIEFISVDSSAKNEFPFKRLKFEINNNVGYGIGVPFMSRFYVAQTLGIEPNKIDFKDSTIIEMFKNLELEEYQNLQIQENSQCLNRIQKNNVHNNVYLSFARKNEKVVFVNASRIYIQPRHTNGIFYLFFIDSENRIIKTYRVSWME